MKQKAGISVCMLSKAELIFLDEPTSGVDPVSRRTFWLLIYELAEQGKTVFVTTHYMDEAEYCRSLSIMKDGKIVELENPQVLKKKYEVDSMQEVFLKIVRQKEHE